VPCLACPAPDAGNRAATTSRPATRRPRGALQPLPTPLAAPL